MLRLLFPCVLAAAAICSAPASHAQTAPPQTSAANESQARAAMTVQRSLSVATISPMRFERDAGAAALSAQNDGMTTERPAVIRLSGDPGRAYRIRLPRREASFDAVEGLQILSANDGDISLSLGGRLNAQGHDVLEIRGRLRAQTGHVAALPLSIDYD